jgi:hypothetical protein
VIAQRTTGALLPVIDWGLAPTQRVICPTAKAPPHFFFQLFSITRDEY